MILGLVIGFLVGCSWGLYVYLCTLANIAFNSIPYIGTPLGYKQMFVWEKRRISIKAILYSAFLMFVIVTAFVIRGMI